VEKLNTTRLTLTAGVINNAETVIFLVSGAGKADMLHTLLEESPRPDDFPSQRIHPLHGTLLVLADRDAAAKLHIES
jgi:6-phosphogluconolactonase